MSLSEAKLIKFFNTLTAKLISALNNLF